MHDEGLLTAEQAQELLGISRATFWKVVKRHEVARFRVPASPKRVYFRREDIAKLGEPVQMDVGAQLKTAA